MSFVCVCFHLSTNKNPNAYKLSWVINYNYICIQDRWCPFRLVGDIKHFKLYGHGTISSTYKTGGVPADCSKCALGLRSPTKPASSHASNFNRPSFNFSIKAIYPPFCFDHSRPPTLVADSFFASLWPPDQTCLVGGHF